MGLCREGCGRDARATKDLCDSCYRRERYRSLPSVRQAQLRANRKYHAKRYYFRKLRGLDSTSTGCRFSREFATPVENIRPFLLGQNLVALCQESGVAYRTLIRIKNGPTKVVSLRTADRICTALGIHLEDVAA